MESHPMLMDWENIVKISILQRAIHRFDEISIKTPMAFFKRSRIKHSKFIWNHKRPLIAKEI